MAQNLALYSAAYPDASMAQEDFESLKSAQSAGDFAIVGAVVVSRDSSGKIEVKEHGATPTGGGAVLGAIGGLVVGLFAPPLLLSTAMGAGIGAGIGELVKRHEQKELGVDFEEFIPAGTSAVVVVAEDMYADGIDKALGKASKKITKAIDKGDVDKLSKALSDAGYDVSKAIMS